MRRFILIIATMVAVLTVTAVAVAQVPVEPKAKAPARFNCGRICTTFISASPTSAPIGQNITITGHTLFGAGYAGTFDVSFDSGAHWFDSGFSGTTDANGNVVITVTSAQPVTQMWRFNAAGHQSDPVTVSWY